MAISILGTPDASNRLSYGIADNIVSTNIDAANTSTVTNGGAGKAGDYLALDTNGAAAGRVLETDGAKLDLLPARVQSGTLTLASGVKQVTGLNITSGSRIFLDVSTSSPGAGNLTVQYAALAADRVVGAGTGSFKATALLAAGTINNVDTSILDWTIIG